MIEHSQYKKLNNCLCCDGSNLDLTLNLGDQPLANSYPKTKDEVEDYFPLAVNYCNDCTHLQLTHAVNPDLLFKNYLYVSGTTKTLKKYFDDFVLLTEKYFPIKKKLSVLDIACNDGSQLDSYKVRGHETYGIDPAENLYELSSKNHTIVCDYLTEQSIFKLNKKFDLILAQNVLAHNSYPKEFLEICKQSLSKNGRIFIQTSQANMIEMNQFDTIYHEHISFFNVRSMVALLKRSGLYLENVLKTDIHGTSYVFVLSPDKTNDHRDYLIMKDTHFTKDKMNRFADSAVKVVRDLKQELNRYSDCITVGYGAAAKGNTLLNFGEIDLDYIIDDNPLKQNLYTPGRKIPIVSLDEFLRIAGKSKVVWIPLSWNFFSEIKDRVKSKLNKPAIFIQYFPDIKRITE